jgi:murein DD-endopeptidase MepM/ murein hydrolase activator NlpD
MLRRFNILLLLLVLLLLGGFGIQSTQADTATDLQNQINDRNEKIKSLEAEIAQYQSSLSATSKQSTTLAGELSLINLTVKKLNADISLTKNKIKNSEQTIQKLQLDIGNKDLSIDQNHSSLAELLRLLRQSQDTNLLEQVAGNVRFSDFWSEEEKLANLQDQLNDEVSNLRNIRADLVDKKAQTEKEKKKLQALNSQLADQKKIADASYAEKNRLLASTKNQEAGYRKLLADRQAKKELFQKELFQIESQLKGVVDKSLLPHTGTGVLGWPLSKIVITQYFGRTVAAARLYVSGSHNGVDFGVSMGTPVFASESGVVAGTGNTDIACAGASWGTWVFIKHDNGLATIYGHLSLSKVIEGQRVNRGDLIAYSGKSGYATGPHLHLSVMAANAVNVGTLVSKSCPGAVFRIPLTPVNAYLDPMQYL